MMSCVAEGHEIIALANLKPKDKGAVIISVTIGIYLIYLHLIVSPWLQFKYIYIL